MARILFSNFPWFVHDTTKPHLTFKQGIRAGSRWPFVQTGLYFSPDQFRFGGYLPAPQFLMSAASFLERAVAGEHSVVIRDSIARGESYATFLRFFDSLRPDFLIVEVGSASFDHDRAFMALLKKRRPEMKIAIAGPSAKTVFESKDKCDVQPIDCWFQGEYEHHAVDFVTNGATGLLPMRLLSREELTRVPFPMYDEPASLNYWDACPAGQQAPHLQLWASRGCVYKCTFCAWPGTMTGDDPDGTKPRSVRHYTPIWLDAFIRERIAKSKTAGTPFRSIYFDDDWWNNSRRENLAVCEVMKRIGLPWFAMCRSDTSDKETWTAMRDSGCRGVKVGFESASQRVIDQIVNKRLNVAEGVEWCRFIKSLGMTVHTTWTCGLPGETAEEQNETRALIQKMYDTGAHDTHQLSGTAVLDGTPLALIEKGEHLAKYPGAVADENYHSSKDGVAKIESMSK